MPSPRRSRLRPKPRHPQSRTAGRPNIGQFTGVESNPNLADLDPDTRFPRDDRCLDHEQFDDIESVSSRNRAPFQGFPGRSQSSRARCRSRTSWLSAVGGYLPVTPEVMEELEQRLLVGECPTETAIMDQRGGPIPASVLTRELTNRFRVGSLECGDTDWENDVITGSLPRSSPLKRQRSNRSARSTTSSARRRQNEDGCVTCLRGMLHCYNVFILIVGCASLGVGIWLLVTDFGARKVTPIVGNQLYEVTTYLLMAGGGAVALLAFCGCCGTIREDKCVLSFYGTTLAIVLIVLGASCVLAIFFRTEVESNVQFRMKETLTKHYGVDISRDSKNRRITEAWDAMQRQLKCCGVHGNVTGPDSFLMYKSIRWSKYKKNSERIVPESCCAPGDVKICTGETEFSGPPIYFNAHTDDLRKKNPYLYTDGCYDSLIKYLKTYSTVVAGVSAIVPLFLIFGIVISFCLCARVTGYSTDDEVDLDNFDGPGRLPELDNQFPLADEYISGGPWSCIPLCPTLFSQETVFFHANFKSSKCSFYSDMTDSDVESKENFVRYNWLTYIGWFCVFMLLGCISLEFHTLALKYVTSV
ncbi:hypothetical protein RRG08_041054 [Elysia crispata]|uniref:Tetraspanin n=1 Tax=Elysia crispata TaxID=231223 RepID=A0AAE1CU09_9GAST|nr:hypothetical protein RRG08_041054 [Elysia crispata]